VVLVIFLDFSSIGMSGNRPSGRLLHLTDRQSSRNSNRLGPYYD
jgi:hypothetical protein